MNFNVDKFFIMITVISGTNRINSNSLIISKACCDELNKLGVESKLFCLSQLPHNFMKVMYSYKDNTYNNIIKKNISTSNKYIFVIAEYNGSYPGILKAFIDSIQAKEFENKKACIIGVSTGYAGALRPLDHFTDVLHHLKTEVMSHKLKLSKVYNNINAKKEVDDELRAKLLYSISKFVEY